MDFRDDASAPWFGDPQGSRQHRFMESADINAAFRELFEPLRTGVRRGLSNEGQVYALEMDSVIPGELLGTSWIPVATRGVDGSLALADPARRRALFDILLAEKRVEALFAYVCERVGPNGSPYMYLEIISTDGCFAAQFPIVQGKGWYKRDLQKVPHRRLDPVALA
jgi:hypothetical protein